MASMLEAAARISDELADVGRRLTMSVVEVRTHGHGAAAGTVWSADGVIVTNRHVAPGEEAEVTLPDGRTLPARTLADDRENDLAVLQVRASGLAPAPLGDARALRPGDLVIAVGHPFGVRQAMTAGIVTVAPGSASGGRELVRASLMLLPGNSGGPLADAQGRVVGINAMVAGGLALAVPSHLVTRLVGAQLRPRTLGVQGVDVEVPRAYAAAAAGATRAVLVRAVAPGSVAESAGIATADLILAVNGVAVDGVEGMRRALAGAESDVVTVRLLRGGRPLAVIADFGRGETQRAA